MLNIIWIGLFLIAFLTALIRLVFFHDHAVFSTMLQSTFSSSAQAFDFALNLTGAMTLWLGIMNIGEKAGAIRILSRIIGPFFSRLFPQIPKDHPALGQIILNFSANMLGLGNAATPMGLKAMQSMQDLNEDKEKASNSQIMFLVINTAGFALIPVSIMVYRAKFHAANPADVFLPILLATLVSTLAGIIMVGIRQRIKLWDPVLLLWLLGIITVVGGVVYGASRLSMEQLSSASSFISSFILLSIMISFIGLGAFRKIDVYNTFIEGAKEGFLTVIKLIPYIVAMLVGVAIFNAAGCMGYLQKGLTIVLTYLGCPTDIVPAIPTAFIRPLSSSGASAITVDIINHGSVDSFAARLSSVIQGSSDTTFYIIALYFGSVGIKKTRYAITFGLLTDLCGFLAAIFMAYLFFKH
ncbi:MAG TPA: nucleoside recognition domain-containing protein [Bacteroidia bacterium]|jgi:spore maturation protein SpmA|nr:nucleoside recognition domain-containing protein [Bacteroidia bacterium]